MNDTWTTYFDHGWMISVLPPNEPPAQPPLILLHGLSGDEHSVKPLVLHFKRNRWMLSPRGVVSASEGGFAWSAARTRDQAGFAIAMQALSQEWTNLQLLLGITSNNADLLGFSQGAAFASLLLLQYPDWIRNIAILSGFVPTLDATFTPPSLAGHKIFISHGTEDERIPFSDSQQSSILLSSLGADVTFCKSNTRHKIGAYCVQQLEGFFC